MKTLKFLIAALAALGIVLDATVATYAMLALVPVWFAVGRPLHGALGSLWTVRIEPSPSDLLSILSWHGQGRLPSLPRTTLSYAFILFTLVTTLHMAAAVNLAAALKFGLVTIYLMLTMFVIPWQAVDRDWLRSLRSMYQLSVFITAAVLLIIFVLWKIGLGSIVSDLMYGGNENTRAEGFFKDSNVAGPFVVTGFAWMLSRMLLRRERFNVKNVLLLLLLAGAVGVTFSRGALLNLGITTIAVAWFAARSAGQRVKWLLVAGLLVAGGYLGSGALFESGGQADRFQATNSYDTEGRFVSWEAGIETFLTHPLGVGPGQFETYSRAYQEQVAWNASVTPSAHSTVVRVLTEGGVVGGFLIALMLWLVLRAGLRAIREAQVTGQVFLHGELVWLVAAFLGTLIEGVIIDTLHWRHLWVLGGFILAAQQLLVSAPAAAAASPALTPQSNQVMSK